MFSLIAAAICVFLPPTGWEIAHLKTPSPHVLVGFIGKGSTEFRPSINLAIEEVDVSLKEYVKAVKEIHLENPKAKWRDLGKFPMKAGEGRLTELTNPSPWGEMKVFQAMVVKDSKAYILTAAVLKQDLPKHQAAILDAFRSADVIPDLWTPIVDVQKREELTSLFATLGQSGDVESEKLRLQQEVDSQVELGPYWQFLVLKDGLAKIHSK
jgi:hypothetical protein